MQRILVVDDDDGTRITYRAALLHEGYDVVLVDSCSSAIRTLNSASPLDAQLLDLNLPDGTGYDVLRWMRAARRFLPTAVTTAFAAAYSPDEAIELGALAYIDHPLPIEALLPLVRALTQRPSTHDDPNRLHHRVLAGDCGALECLDAIFIEQLQPRLERAFPAAPWDLLAEAISDACLEYGAAPHRFHAHEGASILDFAFGIAWRNAVDRHRSELSRKNRERRWGLCRPRIVMPEFEIPRATLDVCAAVMALATNDHECRAAEIWLSGGTREEIAVALGHACLNSKARAHVAKQFVDRLKKRLSRSLNRPQLMAEVDIRPSTSISSQSNGS